MSGDTSPGGRNISRRYGADSDTDTTNSKLHLSSTESTVLTAFAIPYPRAIVYS